MNKWMSSCLTGMSVLVGVTLSATSGASGPTTLESISPINTVAIAGECKTSTAVSGAPAWQLTRLKGHDGAKVTFSRADGKMWDLSTFSGVRITVHNPGTSPVTFRAQITNPAATDLAGTCQTAATLMPGQSQNLDLRVIPTPADPGFDPFKPFLKYYSVVNVRDNTVDASSIDAVTFWIDDAKEGDSVQISDLQLTGVGTKGQPPFFPFIDKYGQYMHADWPGKIHGDADFAMRRAEEEKERADWPGPSDWNKYGGWSAGPQLEATGNFRVAKHESKWWLVDPEGKLFWSYGPTGAGSGTELTPITDREFWFAELPPRDGPLGKYYSPGNPIIYMYYRDREWTGFQFSRVNIERKYGPDAMQELKRITAERLRSWGFNTMGNWSSAEMMAYNRTPYVTAIHFDAPRLNDHMPDVFNPDWEAKLRERLERERDTTAKEPWNIGYFVDNERSWGKYARFAGVAIQTLQAPPTVASKLVFVNDLKAKYATIEGLNSAWQTNHASWDALLESCEKIAVSTPMNPNMESDCGDFGEKFSEKYFSTCRKLVKDVAPNHMYLGARLHGHIDPSLIRLQARYCDVISYNIYDASPDRRLKAYDDLDFPILVTEWGIDNDRRQSPFRATTVQVAIGSPGPRRDRLVQFARRTIAHPKIVGAHFFQYRDQPLSGRPDGEALFRGFINGTDTPNFELIQANRELTYDLYKQRVTAR